MTVHKLVQERACQWESELIIAITVHKLVQERGIKGKEIHYFALLYLYSSRGEVLCYRCPVLDRQPTVTVRSWI